MNVTLTKLSKNKNAFRTKVVCGSCDDYPKLGETFVVKAKGLSRPDALRIVETSRIKSIEVVGSGFKARYWIIRTENSAYQLDFAGGDKR